MRELKLFVPSYVANVANRSSQGAPSANLQEGDEPLFVSHTKNAMESVFADGDAVTSHLNDAADFGRPFVPVLVHEAEGIRIALGTHDYEDLSKPDIQVERRPNGWVIFLHPVGGSDPSGLVYILDDGRSFLMPARCLGPTPQIQVLEVHENVPELDQFA